MKTVFTRVKARVGPVKVRHHENLVDCWGKGHEGWTHVDIFESCLVTCAREFAALVLKIE